ncbi:ankyrin repeat-containing domain protein [Xylaria palmicola]|nr:ankyrin repeat-containing domain protein [Xylaria palmicola]
MSRKSFKLSDQEWDDHKDLIRKVYLEDNQSLKEVRSVLKDKGLDATAHQIETKIKKWKFRKNVDKATWISIDQHITKRKHDDKESEVILCGKRMKPETVKRETDRHGDRSVFTQLALRNSSLLPLTDYRVAVCTPQPINMEYEWPATLPWFMFSSRDLPRVLRACKPFTLESQNASSGDLISTILPKALRTDMAYIGVSKLAAIIGRSMPERYPQENLERAQNLLSGPAEDCVREYVSMIIYNVSNNGFYLNQDDKWEPIMKVLEDCGVFRLDVKLGEDKSPTIQGFMEKLFNASIHICFNATYNHSRATRAETAVKWIITSGYCPNTALKALWRGLPHFFTKVHQNVLYFTKRLLIAGADANECCESNGKSPTILEIALGTFCDNDEVFNLAELLFKHGASKNLNWALHSAIRRQQKGVIEMIVQHGGDITAVFEYASDSYLHKATALTAAVSMGLQQVSHILDLLSLHYRSTPLATFIIPDVFIAAAAGGHDDIIQCLYKISPTIMANEYGITPLHAAARYGHLSTCRVLLPLKGIHNTWATEKFPPLHVACHGGHKDVVEFLIRNGADVNATPIFGSDAEELRFTNRLSMDYWPGKHRNRIKTPPLDLSLYLAQLRGICRDHYKDLCCAAMLIRAGAKLVGNELSLAGYHCHLELLQATIAAGADPNRFGWRMKTALQCALQGISNRSNRLYGVVSHLLSEGAQILDGDVDSAVVLKQYDVARLLTEYGGKMSQMALRKELEKAILVRDNVWVGIAFEIEPSIYSAGALYAAIVMGNDSLIQSLMQNRLAVRSDPFEITAIAVAAMSGNLDLLQKLLAHPPSCHTGPLPLGSVDGNGGKVVGSWVENIRSGKYRPERRLDLRSTCHSISTCHSPSSCYECSPCRPRSSCHSRFYGSPLALVASSMGSGALEACSYLLESGFCADELTWVAAASFNNTAFVRTLLKHNQRGGYSYYDFEGWYPLAFAIQHRNKELVALLLTAGIVANGRGPCVGEPLLAAVTMGDLDMVDYLVQAGADVNADDRPQGGSSPLQTAVKGGKIDIVDYLIRAGANVNAKYRYTSSPEMSPLLIAVNKGKFGIVNSLIRAGADVNHESCYRSPLQRAVEQGKTDMVYCLVQAGADVDSPGAKKRGATPLQFAAINGYLGLAKYLIDQGAQVNAPPSPYGGRTALQGAAEHGRLDMLQFLLTEGALTTGRWRRCFVKAVKLAIKERHFVAADLLKRSAGWSEEDENLLPWVDVDCDIDSGWDELDDVTTDDMTDSDDEECDFRIDTDTSEEECDFWIDMDTSEEE